MNIFEHYLIKINKPILDNKKILKLKNVENLNSSVIELPPKNLTLTCH